MTHQHNIPAYQHRKASWLALVDQYAQRHGITREQVISVIQDPYMAKELLAGIGFDVIDEMELGRPFKAIACKE